METYNDCYLFGFVGAEPVEFTNKDVWKASLPLSFLSFDNKLTQIEIVLCDETKRTEFLKRRPYELLSLQGHLQYHKNGQPYIYVEEYAVSGISKTTRSAILRLVGHTGSRVFLKGRRTDRGLFVPRIGQKKNITDGDLFAVDGDTLFRGQLTSTLSLRKEGDCYAE